MEIYRYQIPVRTGEKIDPPWENSLAFLDALDEERRERNATYTQTEITYLEEFGIAFTDDQIEKAEQRKDRTLENRLRSATRARNRIRRLALTNFTSHDKFITLTFREGLPFDIKNVKACNQQFKKFIQRFKYRYPEFKYISVIEFQDKNGRGAVHYHMLANLPFVEWEYLKDKIWKLGGVYIEDIREVDNVGAYLTYYMTKDIMDTRLEGLPCYLVSRNMEQPVELTDEDADRVIDFYGLNENNAVFNNSYSTEYFGEVQYHEYNINRPEPIKWAENRLSEKERINNGTSNNSRLC